jgi:hypothetical protein
LSRGRIEVPPFTFRFPNIRITYFHLENVEVVGYLQSRERSWRAGRLGHHNNLATRLPAKCHDVDQPMAALIQHLDSAASLTTGSSSGAANSAGRRSARALQG